MTGPTLHGDEIVRRHGGLVAVDRVHVTVAPGRVLGIIGPNGAGKSTLLDCLAGTQPLDRGRVRLGDRDITRTSPDERSRRGLVRTFQRSSVFGSLTVEENLRIGAENRHRRGLVRGILGARDRARRSARAIVSDVLDQLGLRPLASRPTAGLSTGTLRMVELARALCSQPSVLLLDEPASGLDDTETDHLRDLLVSLRRSGLGIALVEHDLDLVGEVADTLVVMMSGRVLAEGPPAEVLARPDVRLAITGVSR